MRQKSRREPTDDAPLTFSLKAAQRFLGLLDPEADEFTFQTFDDDPERKDRRLAQILHGSLDRLAPSLQDLQEAGAGVFVMVNEGDGKGRSKENVTRVRAVFVDGDGQVALEELIDFDPEPHLIVESSPGHFQAYWLTDGLPIDQFEGVQRRIADTFGTDPVIDACRVMRVPGFWHEKEETIHPVRTAHEYDLPPYEADRVLKAFPPSERQAGADFNSSEWPDELPDPLPTSEVEQLRAARPDLFDLARYDGDQSRRDLALAGFAQRAGWSKEKVAALIRAVRQEENDPKADDRADYVWRTIAEAYAPQAALLILDPKAPLLTANQFVLRYYRPADAPAIVDGLVNHRDEFYRWNGACYVRVEERQLEFQLYEFLKDAVVHTAKGIVPFNPTKAKIGQIIHALAGVTWQNSDKEPPFTLLPAGDVKASVLQGMLPCRNGMLDIKRGTFQPHRPEIFNINILDFDYDPDAPEPIRWLEFLEELWPEDKESRDTLQEIMGYLISTDTEQQKIFFFVGPRRGGKGTILRVLTGIVGKRNVAAPTFKSLASHFGLQPLIGKTIAAISDARLGANTDVVTVVERMLRISGEDDVTADRKYKDHWTGRMGARFLIMTNELPRLTDASTTIVSRLVPIIFTRSFYGKEDTLLAPTLLLERSGIVNWAIVGYERLKERENFVVPKSARTAIQQMEDLASPMRAFLRVRCVVKPGERVWTDDIYEAWTEWQTMEGSKAMSRAVFGQHLHAICPQVRRRQAREGRYYDGISLKPKRRHK